MLHHQRAFAESATAFAESAARSRNNEPCRGGYLELSPLRRGFGVGDLGMGILLIVGKSIWTVFGSKICREAMKNFWRTRPPNPASS